MNFSPNHKIRPAKGQTMSLWLVVLLASLPFLCAGNANRVQFDAVGTRTYSGRDNCNSEWCGETWRMSRILYYNLTVEFDGLKKVNKTVAETHNDCAGSQISSNCEQTHSEEQTTETKQRVITTARVSDTPIEVRDSLELDHFSMLSDNAYWGDNGIETTSDLYPANLTKIWQWRIPKGCKMHVRFTNFSIEESDNCERDYFSMQTSKDPNDILVFCNKLDWIEIKYRKRVQFTLHSDYAVNDGVLAAKISYLKLNCAEGEDCTCDQPLVRRRKRSPTPTGNQSTEPQSSSTQQSTRSRRLSALKRLRESRQALS